MKLWLSLADRALRWAAVLLLASLLATVVAGVLARMIGKPLAWTDEAAQYLLVWAGFVGLMIATRRRSHIRITMLIDRLPDWAGRLAEIAIRGLIVLFAVQMTRYGYPLIGRNWDIDWVSLPLPSGLLYLPIPFVAAILIIQATVEAVTIARFGTEALGKAGEVQL